MKRPLLALAWLNVALHIVGLAFAAIGVIGYATATVLGIVATAFALIAAFLNAAFGLCLGCELYLIIRRFMPARQAP